MVVRFLDKCSTKQKGALHGELLFAHSIDYFLSYRSSPLQWIKEVKTKIKIIEIECLLFHFDISYLTNVCIINRDVKPKLKKCIKKDTISDSANTFL